MRAVHLLVLLLAVLSTLTAAVSQQEPMRCVGVHTDECHPVSVMPPELLNTRPSFANLSSLLLHHGVSLHALPQPAYTIRIQGILVANSDGTGGASSGSAMTAAHVSSVVVELNKVYAAANMQFVFDQNNDFTSIRDSELNLDYTVPSGLNYNRPESTPPMTDDAINALPSKQKTDQKRQSMAAGYRHKLVLFFADGNCFQYDKSAKKWSVTPRTWAYSGSDLEYVMLPATHGSALGDAYLWAHESGHYFHQPHTHSWSPKNVSEAIKIMKDQVARGAVTKANALNVFDGDGLSDTPPDASNEIFDSQYGQGGCGAQGSIVLKVQYPNDRQVYSYTLAPDRANALSYFKHCTNFVLHFSNMQITGMRKSLSEQNRYHLVHGSMRLQQLQVTGTGGNNAAYTAVFVPGSSGEQQVYGWTYDDYRRTYDQIWGQGWRLKSLSCFVLNNADVRYTAVWRPGYDGETQVYGWTMADVQNIYYNQNNPLFQQGWRVKLAQPYVLNGGDVRWTVVWEQSTRDEYVLWDKTTEVLLQIAQGKLGPQGYRLKILQPYYVNGVTLNFAVYELNPSEETQEVYDWALGDLRNKYDQLWPQGWRLKLLQPYLRGSEGMRYSAVWHKASGGEIQLYGWSYTDYRAYYDRIW